MATADSDWKEFFEWSKIQIINGQGYRNPQSAALQAALREKWDDIVDKQEYLRAIRRYEQRALEVADVVNDDPIVQSDRRIVRALKSRATAVAMKSSYLLLESLQRVQKKRNRRGQTITFTAVIRHHDRLIKEAKEEIIRRRETYLHEAEEEICAAFPNLPDDVLDYIDAAYEEVPWEDVEENDVTDREVTTQLRAELLTAQDYNDVKEVDWDRHRTPSQLVRTSRNAGRVRCGGHEFSQRDMWEDPIERCYMSSEWEDYLAAYTTIRERDRAVPCWTIQAAKTRAEMLWDHTGVAIFPPEADHSDLELTLDQILQAEDKYYQDRETKLWHVPIEYAIAEHLNDFAERPCMLPAFRTRPLFVETVNMLADGRRALQHAWESKLWEMIRTEKRSGEEVSATYALYIKALNLFDADPLISRKERQWLSPEYTALLSSLPSGPI